MTIDGMIFDLDGTLADTLPVCFAAFRESFQHHLGTAYTDQQIYAMFGPSEEGIFQHMLGERWGEGLQTYLTAYEREHGACAAVFAGLDDALSALLARGVRLAIVTAKGAGSAEISVRCLGLDRYFDLVESGSAQGGIKPERIRRVLANWDVPAARVAYVGDSVYDVSASREAGTLPLAAAWASTARTHLLQQAGPHALFDTVAQFRAWIDTHVRVS